MPDVSSWTRFSHPRDEFPHTFPCGLLQVFKLVPTTEVPFIHVSIHYHPYVCMLIHLASVYVFTTIHHGKFIHLPHHIPTTCQYSYIQNTLISYIHPAITRSCLSTPTILVIHLSTTCLAHPLFLPYILSYKSICVPCTSARGRYKLCPQRADSSICKGSWIWSFMNTVMNVICRKCPR